MIFPPPITLKLPYIISFLFNIIPYLISQTSPNVFIYVPYVNKYIYIYYFFLKYYIYYSILYYN